MTVAIMPNRHCKACDTEWRDSDHCWYCGQPSPGSRPALPVISD